MDRDRLNPSSAKAKGFLKMRCSKGLKAKHYKKCFFAADVFTWHHFTPMSKQLKCYAWYEWVFTALYMIRWIICPILLSPPGKSFVTNFDTGKSRYNFLVTNFLHHSLGGNSCGPGLGCRRYKVTGRESYCRFCGLSTGR